MKDREVIVVTLYYNYTIIITHILLSIYLRILGRQTFGGEIITGAVFLFH